VIASEWFPNKEDWGKEKEIEEELRKIEKIVPKKFLRWRKVFGKVEFKRMLTRKIWDHAIDLKETFKPWKGKIYPLSKNEREKVQNFVEISSEKGISDPQSLHKHCQYSLRVRKMGVSR